MIQLIYIDVIIMQCNKILPTGAEAISIFSGVFQPNIDLPYLNSVLVDSLNYYVNNSFQQHYNHYHCAVLPVFSESSKLMSTVFFWRNSSIL